MQKFHQIDLKVVAGNSSQHSTKQHKKSAENFNLLKQNVKNLLVKFHNCKEYRMIREGLGVTANRG